MTYEKVHKLLLLYNFHQAMIQKCSTGHVGIEDSADGSVMLRSTSLVITVVHENTGRLAETGIYYIFRTP